MPGPYRSELRAVDLLAGQGVAQLAPAERHRRAEDRRQPGPQTGPEPKVLAHEERAAQQEIGALQGRIAGAAMVPHPRRGIEEDGLRSPQDLHRQARARAWYDCGRAIGGSPLREWRTPACGPAGPPTR